jgi:phytanoyl-CoA hydroxylase
MVTHQVIIISLQIQEFLFDDVLFKYCAYPPVVDVIERIIGTNITGAHSMLINKPPNSDPRASLHSMHQVHFEHCFCI